MMCNQLIKAQNDPNIRAVVIRIDTPGERPCQGSDPFRPCIIPIPIFIPQTDQQAPKRSAWAADFMASSLRDIYRARSHHKSTAGGSAVASDTIYREVLKLRKSGVPVIVSMGNVAASGGYYIAAPATKIVAQPSSVTGSIGVVRPLNGCNESSRCAMPTRDSWSRVYALFPGPRWDPHLQGALRAPPEGCIYSL